MPRGKPSPKLAITVDPDVHAGVVAAAHEDGVSVSAWMTNAARRALLIRDGLKAVAAWEAEHGPFTEAELTAARSRVAEELPSAAIAIRMTVAYDAGVLVAADRSDRKVWADHRIRLELGLLPVTTAPVVAQVSRSPRQVQLRRFLNGCDVLPLLAESAHEIGALAGASGTSDVVDAHLVLVAAAYATGGVLTSDEGDLRRLAVHVSSPVPIIAL